MPAGPRTAYNLGSRLALGRGGTVWLPEAVARGAAGLKPPGSRSQAQPEKRPRLWRWLRRRRCVSSSGRSPQTGPCGDRAVVPPPSGSVSASLRSAFLFPFSSFAAAGARVPTNSSSSSLLCLLPSGQPPAPPRTKTQTLKSQRGSHFRRPAPASPPRRCT